MKRKRISKTKLANKIARRVKQQYAPVTKALTSKRSRYHWIEDALDYEEV